MLVCVTGGTGFVGAHSVAALVREGAAVRLLARDPSRVEGALRPLGVPSAAVQVVTGDVTDRARVAAALRGVDAVLHAASVYSFDTRRYPELRRTNVSGTELVLQAAVRAGVGRIVHVSSVAALYPAPAGEVTAQSPVGSPKEAYMASKAEAELVARRFQAEGAPVAITYPPALIGPYDPHLGDQNARLRNELRGLMPMWPLGGFPLGDVRDTAELHARLLLEPGREHGRDPGGRYFGPGRYLTTRQYLGSVGEVTGRRLPALFLPPAAMLPVGRAVGLVQRVWPWHIPAEYGAVYICAAAAPVAKDVPTGGLSPRPLADSLGDTVRWLHTGGLLSARQAGDCARPRSAAAIR
ncbi:SDR family NAD(P)-dependent oxidoreductase [Kitasatospora kifunensis]|uniref:Nucleoside-diphosphate-sugar epimerase n=1 Tax=Kitasatospora kifunensis TaxID=58351 RepID=A0A7W7R0C1_KITKI|nr:SDR family NAD(P)-dependent oxidoreductase [Kitasatospora kifunensis]MBB4922466.1 nucleoside-diphosphate-sugar epimerase [Kitasatospora kifunensis]